MPKAANDEASRVASQEGDLKPLIAMFDELTRPAPSVERGEAGEFVRVSFLRFGQPGVAIQGRRGGGEWEDLAISLKSPWFDRRPLLVPGQPEVREYRLQFFSGSAPVGDFTPVAGITVSP